MAHFPPPIIRDTPTILSRGAGISIGVFECEEEPPSLSPRLVWVAEVMRLGGDGRKVVAKKIQKRSRSSLEAILASPTTPGRVE